jgi:hypothetical protein
VLERFAAARHTFRLMPSHDSPYDKSPQIDHRTIGGEAFIITAADSKIHSLNAVGSFVFDLCDGKTGIETIVRAVVAEFEVDEAQARSDVEAFLASLEQRGMVVRQ